ncbi:MAG: hypothetical protein MRY78_18065, partial [Saprospiraceae bacterium]|nr:hypothetical protein [Saprospiraceae bacterium]
MKSKVIVLITLFVIASLATLSAQTKKAWQKAADESFQEGDYFSAYEYYQITLEFDSTDLVNRYRLAESARNYGSFAKADTAYQKLIQVDTSNRFPIAHFWRGEMNRYLGKYNLAKASYQKFLQLHSRNSGPIVRKAKQSIENCEWAQEEMAKQVQSPDTILHAGNEINSPYSDFAPALYGDSLYFSSFRFVYEKDTLDPPRPYIKIMKAVEGDKPKVLDDRFNIPTRHAAHTAFNLDYSRVFYTLCDYTASSDVVCELYSRERLYTGEWGEPVKL